jgi:hypothetical protein
MSSDDRARPRPAWRSFILIGAIACGIWTSAPASDAWAESAPGPGLTGPIVAPGPLAKRNIPQDIVRIARAEFHKGVREAPRGSNDSPGIARYRKALASRPRPAAWCAFFASWVAKSAGAPLGRRGAGIASAAGIRSWAQRTGRWRHLPRPGDMAVYHGHVGIVASVEGSRMTTIEGNWSDRVSRLSRGRREALGFARVAVGDHRIGR